MFSSIQQLLQWTSSQCEIEVSLANVNYNTWPTHLATQVSSRHVKPVCCQVPSYRVTLSFLGSAFPWVAYHTCQRAPWAKSTYIWWHRHVLFHQRSKGFSTSSKSVNTLPVLAYWNACRLKFIHNVWLSRLCVPAAQRGTHHYALFDSRRLRGRKD